MESCLLFTSFLGAHYDNVRHRCFFFTCIPMLLMSVLPLRRDTEALQVIGGDVTVVQGDAAILPCILIDTVESLVQISWQRRTRKNPLNDNFLIIESTSGLSFVSEEDDRFKFVGSFNENNGSLQLSNVTLGDEGTYTCIFTLFPSGNHKMAIPLTLLVPPFTSIKDNHPTLGNEEVDLATCTAAGSKPPAEVKWITDGELAQEVKWITNFTQHDNGTTTTVSSLIGVPTRKINQYLVKCVITSAAPLKEEILPVTIQVQFPPMEVNISESSKDRFECITEANPNANFTWTRIGLSLPQSAVRVEGAKLHFLHMTSDVNGVYQCEAYNPYGRKQSLLYVHVVSGACVAGWLLFGLSLIAVAVATVVFYLYKSDKLTRTGHGTPGKRQAVRTSADSPDETDREEVEAERAL